jgi:hypothetical protein
MLLSKTGWRIKRLISQKREDTMVDTGRASQSEERSTRQQSRHQSWLSQPPKDANSLMLRRTNSITPTRTTLSLPPIQTAHSSASSLCSCNYDGNPPHPLSQSELPLLTPKILYLDLEESTPNTSDAQKWRKIFEGPLSSMATTSTVFPSSTSAVGLDSKSKPHEGLSLLSQDEEDGDKTPTQDDLNGMDDKTEIPWSPNVQQLIEQTDEAFKAVGFVLANSKSSNQEWYPDDDAATDRTRQPRIVLRKQHKAPVARAASVSKPKRRKSEKQKTGIKPVKSPTPTSSPRWTLSEVTDGMTGLLTGKGFNRGTAVAEATLISGGVGQLKIDSKTELASEEFSRTTASGLIRDLTTPIEPFYLQDLPSRICAIGVEAPSEEVTNTTSLAPPIPDRSMKRRTCNKSLELSPANARSDLTFHDVTFPSPPMVGSTMTPPHRNTPQLLILPTIPEVPRLSTIKPNIRQSSTVSPLTPQVWQNATSNSTIRDSGSTESTKKSFPSPLTPQTPSTFVLESTPYSLTSNGFRHGSIRLNQQYSQFRKNSDTSTPSPVSSRNISPSSSRPPSLTSGNKTTSVLSRAAGGFPQIRGRKGSDTPHDWTAFQMAISGGTGDYLMEDYYSFPSQLYDEETTKEEDEIFEWWSSYGFRLGGLLKEDPRITRKRKLKERLRMQAVEAWGKMDRDLASETNMRDQTNISELGKASEIMTDASNEVKR